MDELRIHRLIESQRIAVSNLLRAVDGGEDSDAAIATLVTIVQTYERELERADAEIRRLEGVSQGLAGSHATLRARNEVLEARLSALQETYRG